MDEDSDKPQSRISKESLDFLLCQSHGYSLADELFRSELTDDVELRKKIVPESERGVIARVESRLKGETCEDSHSVEFEIFAHHLYTGIENSSIDHRDVIRAISKSKRLKPWAMFYALRYALAYNVPDMDDLKLAALRYLTDKHHIGSGRKTQNLAKELGMEEQFNEMVAGTFQELISDDRYLRGRGFNSLSFAYETSNLEPEFIQTKGLEALRRNKNEHNAYLLVSELRLPIEKALAYFSEEEYKEMLAKYHEQVNEAKREMEREYGW